jgi:gliding motility-associated-like protein
MRLNTLKIILSGLLVLLLMVPWQEAGAQKIAIATGQGKVYTQYENKIDNLVILKGITGSTELTVDFGGTTLAVEWYEYFDASSVPEWHSEPVFLSNQPSLSPEDHCGYLVKLTGTVDGQAYAKTLTVFVIDYLRYQPEAIQLFPEDAASCEQLVVRLGGVLPEMRYATPALVYPIEREWMLEYESLEWQDGWADLSISKKIKVENSQFTVTDTPLKDTYFKLTGDQFASDMGIAPFTFTSSLYPARRVVSKITTQATVRTEKHESDRPESITTLTGSAPLEIRFKANGNEPVANYYNWGIYNGETQILSRTAEEHSYTFTTAGTYVVKVRAENETCSFTDSLVVTISESAISAPNAFTPNGDEINDEFRVSYKSIIEFQGVIFNRWGNKLFEWTDIQKGWDGTYKGKAVKEGPYFYVIRAKGSDGIVYNLKGDINLLRGRH